MSPLTMLADSQKTMGDDGGTGDAPLLEQANEAATAIRRRWAGRARAGLILGTGLGDLAKRIETETVIPYEEIPHFPKSTALSHTGQLVCGRLAGSPVVAMEGRCHGYEGYSLEQLILPVYALGALGVEILILSNASGGLNPKYASGDVMVMEDHLDLMFARGFAGRREGTSFMRSASRSYYDPALLDQAMDIARRNDFAAYRGVYAAMTGPNYETRAEYRFLRRIGADVVGMSTAPEAVAAAECGLRTLALSTVTNVAKPDCPTVVTGEDVVAAAASAEPKLSRIVTEIVADPWPAKRSPATARSKPR